MIIHGESLEVLKGMDENSIDTIVTDPPYGLSFMGKKWDYDVPSVELWQECLRVLKPGGTMMCFAGSRTQHRMAVNVEDAGFVLKDCIMWLYGSGFPKATDISKQLDKGHERKVVGVAGKSGSERNSMAGDFKGGEYMKTEAKTPEAQQWEGWKSHGLKPAYEPILVAMKPNDGTYANNALKHGVSGLNIEGSRIPANYSDSETRTSKTGFGIWNKGSRRAKEDGEARHNPAGRFPSNLILDEEAGAMLGEPQRFFYCAKSSKSERNKGCESLPQANNHCTVKPLKLMEYLCTLTATPTKGVVLDPFAGSGTTLLAAKNVGREYIGIEREAEYIDIIKARLK